MLPVDGRRPRFSRENLKPSDAEGALDPVVLSDDSDLPAPREERVPDCPPVREERLGDLHDGDVTDYVKGTGSWVSKSEGTRTSSL